ncbi:MAG: Cytochrome bo(3) ubiquinol oxidase subunit 2 [Chlamydiae bacterium]|nr:Cytochrome bo(3) ubiquinol oxidase subunit 2 [Chlamydiota bacterium]
MKKKILPILTVILVLCVMALGVIYICLHDIPVLNPKGMIGEKERNLIVIAASLMLIVLIPVYILTFIFTRKYKDGNKSAKYEPNWNHSALAETIWWGVPILIISVLGVFTWISSHRLSPFRPIVSEKQALTIQVVALEWKWLFIYPEQGVASINFFQFPENTPVHFEITSDAPMNSFWIPQLGGQIYAMPGRRAQLHLIANEAGEYRGSSANLSGKGFAGMVFTAKASSEEAFHHWVQSAKQSKGLALEQYNHLVEPSENNPKVTYKLTQPNLFDQIMNKYSAPQN